MAKKNLEILCNVRIFSDFFALIFSFYAFRVIFFMTTGAIGAGRAKPHPKTNQKCKKTVLKQTKLLRMCVRKTN